MTRIMSKVPYIILIAIIVSVGMGGCKSQKKLAREKAAAEYAQKVEQAKKNLMAIINDDGSMSLEEKERLLKETKAMNLNEPEILKMIQEAEEVIAAERAEAERLRKEAEAAKKAELSTTEKLDKYFHEIANASSVDMANQKINEAVQMFASPQTPVLIIISREGDIVDYDRPTTIRKYLNYLKDQKKNINAIENVGTDENGKIVELELIKK
jgi:hypothetical protein